jgi:hypothetical protein
MSLSSSPRTSQWQYLNGLTTITWRESMIRYLIRLWLHVKPNTRDVMAFKKNWNNEIIAQFFATLYVEERED